MIGGCFREGRNSECLVERSRLVLELMSNSYMIIYFAGPFFHFNLSIRKYQNNILSFVLSKNRYSGWFFLCVWVLGV